MWIHPFQPRLFLDDPIAVKAVLGANPELFHNDPRFPEGLGVGHGLLGLNASRWRYHRKYMTPAMNISILKDYIPVINDCARIFVQVLQDKQEKSGCKNFFCIKHELNNYTIDVMFRCLMSYETDIQTESEKKLDLIELTEVLAITAHFKAYTPIPDLLWRFHPLRKKQLTAINRIHKILDDVIENRKNNDFFKPKYTNFLDLLLEAEDVDGNGFSKEEVREELLTVMLAGQETTFSTLTWFFSCYAKYPEWAELARNEIKEVLNGNLTQDVTYEHITKLDLVSRMLKESQRMHPTIVQLNPRVLLKTDLKTTDGRVIRKNTDVCVNVAGLHMNDMVYKNPESYNPDRWLENNENSAFAFIPFSAGARSCYGRMFAQIEMKVVILNVISRLIIEP